MLTASIAAPIPGAMHHQAFSYLWRRAAVSAVIAYALVLQVFAASLADAAHAVSRGSSGTVFCLTDKADGSAGGPEKGHDSRCCILGCQNVTAAPGPQPVLFGRDSQWPTLVLTDRSYGPFFTPRALAVLPVGSRAPPRLV